MLVYQRVTNLGQSTGWVEINYNPLVFWYQWEYLLINQLRFFLLQGIQDWQWNRTSWNDQFHNLKPGWELVTLVDTQIIKVCLTTNGTISSQFHQFAWAGNPIWRQTWVPEIVHTCKTFHGNLCLSMEVSSWTGGTPNHPSHGWPLYDILVLNPHLGIPHFKEPPTSHGVVGHWFV